MTSDRPQLDLETLLKETELYEHPGTEKQKDILNAAEKLFSESGFTESSTAEIARKAGVTERTLFKHFPTKQDLLRRILFPLMLKILVPIQVSMLRKVIDDSHATFRDFYIAIAKNRWSEVRVIGPRLKLVIVEALQDSRLRKQARALFANHAWPHILGKVRNFQLEGALRSDVTAEDITQALVTTVMSHALLRGIVASEIEYDDERDLEVTFKILFEGIRPQC